MHADSLEHGCAHSMAGFGGYNTIQAQYLVGEVFSESAMLATLFFGANDAARPLEEGGNE